MKKKLLVALMIACIVIASSLPVNAYILSDTASATASGGGCGYYSCLSTNSTWISFSMYASCSGTPDPDPGDGGRRYVDVFLDVSTDTQYENGRFVYPDDGSSDFVSVGNGGVVPNSAEGLANYSYYGGYADNYITWSDGIFTIIS